MIIIMMRGLTETIPSHHVLIVIGEYDYTNSHRLV